MTGRAVLAHLLENTPATPATTTGGVTMIGLHIHLVAEAGLVVLDEDLAGGHRRGHRGQPGQGALEAAVGDVGDGPVDDMGDLAEALGVGRSKRRGGACSALLGVQELVDHLADAFFGPGQPSAGSFSDRGHERLGLLEGDVGGHGRFVRGGQGVDDDRPVGGERLGEGRLDLIGAW